MYIEVGKEYTTRNGRKARVYATDCGGSHTVHGAVLLEGRWFTSTWTDDGKRNDIIADSWDLMFPKLTKTKYAYLYSDGRVEMSDYSSIYRSGRKVVGTAVVELVEGSFGFDPLAGVKG